MIFSETFFFRTAELIGTLAFAASGAMLAIDRHLDLLGVIVLGVTTALGGGALRDIMSRSTPAVLCKHIYAVASIAGGLLYYLCYYFGWNSGLPVLLSVLLVVIIRLLAAHLRWDLPKIA